MFCSCFFFLSVLILTVKFVALIPWSWYLCSYLCVMSVWHSYFESILISIQSSAASGSIYMLSPSCVHIPCFSMCLLCLCNEIKVAQRVYYRYPISSWNTNNKKKSMVYSFGQTILTRLRRELKVFCMMLPVFRCASISCHSCNANTNTPGICIEKWS